MKKIICNLCGKSIEVTDVEKTDYIEVKKAWGYFSDKDGETHRFCICEACYDAMIKGFQVPVDIEQTKELL